MPQSINLEVKGVHTYNSELSGIPKGALQRALNVNISRLNIAECRRGFNFLAHDLPASADRATRILFYDTKVIAHYSSTLSVYDSGSGWTSLGSLTKPANAKSIKTASLIKNLYTISDSGLKKLDDTSSTLYAAGLPKATFIEAALASGTGTAVAASKYVTYRYVIVRKDANLNVIEGAVSGRATINNTSGVTKDVDLTVYLPTGLSDEHYIQLYRSASSSAEPGDELQLAYEHPLTPAEATAGKATITDIVIDDLLGAYLYTSPSQQGIANDNAEPPLASDIAEYKGHLFFGDVQSKERYRFSLIAAGGSLGFTNNDTITIDDGTTSETFTGKSMVQATLVEQDLTYTADSPGTSGDDITIAYVDGASAGGETVAVSGLDIEVTIQDGVSDADQIKAAVDGDADASALVSVAVSGTGTNAQNAVAATNLTGGDDKYNKSSKEFGVDDSSPSLSIRIDTTINEFLKLANDSSTLVYAYSMSNSDTDLPGKAMLESRSLGADQFEVTSSQQEAFSPQLKLTAGENQKSSSDQYKNGLMFSKEGLPEAVPLKNIFFVGSSEAKILRIKALRDGLFVLKEDGIYVLRGQDEGSFSVIPLDTTAVLVAPDTVEVVNNLIYGLFTAGIGEVSDTGVQFIDLSIRDSILPLYDNPITAVEDYAFGISYQVDGKYILALPEVSSDTYSTQQWVWDVYGRTWCEWDLKIKSGGVDPENSLLYLGSSDSNTIKEERKNRDYTDYADYVGLVTIDSVTDTTLSFSDVSGFSAGDIIYQGDKIAYIESVDPDTNTIEVDAEESWTTGVANVTHLAGILCKVEWNPDFSGNPAGFKQFYEATLLFKTAFQKTSDVYFYSDINPAEKSINVESSSGNGAFGEFEFGSEIFGGITGRQPIRLGVPTGHSRCSLISVRWQARIAYNDYQLNGLSLTFNPTSTRTAR